MKSKIAFIVLALGLTITVNAQSSKKAPAKKEQTKQIAIVKISPAKAAENDANAYADFLGLTETQKQDAQRLFEMKHKVLQNPASSLERKKEMIRIVAGKIAASVDSNQLEKLKANEVLYNQLTNGYDIK